MSTIWKYPLELGETILDMPVAARVLSFDLQGGAPHLWVLVKAAQPLERRVFMIYGTGHACDADPDRFIGMVQMGPFVWHLFEVTVLEGDRVAQSKPPKPPKPPPPPPPDKFSRSFPSKPPPKPPKA